MTNEVTYTSTYLARKFKVSFRKLDYWARTGLLVPSIRPAHGSGNADGYRHLYSQDDHDRLELILLLQARGVSLQAIRAAINRANGNFWPGVTHLARELIESLEPYLGRAQVSA